MSLIKTDKEGRLKYSWYKNKSEYRLKIILEKSRNFALRLLKLSSDLNSIGMEKEAIRVNLKWTKVVYKNAQLDNIITRKFKK